MCLDDFSPMTIRFVVCLALAALTACVDPIGPDVGADNPFAGCYESTCTGAPVRVTAAPAFVSIAANVSNTCGLTAGGEAWCWGRNQGGIVGDGTTDDRRTPTRVAGGIRFTEISVGSLVACGISIDKRAYCWGQGAGGQLGSPATESCTMHGSVVSCAKSPQMVAEREFTHISVGTRHTCALDGDGAAWCWGFNYIGEAGSPTFNETILTPRQVNSTQRFARILAADLHTCALTAAGQAWCWGHNDRGELGRNDTPLCAQLFPTYCSTTPVAAMTNERFIALTTSNSHVCGLTASGAALCWGDNGQRQITSTPPAMDLVLTPVRSQPTMTFSAIDASSAITCATPASGPSVCWGLNMLGKLGVGSRLELSETPIAIAGDRRYVQFAGGAYHVCGLTAEGELWCWGSNRDGQLGSTSVPSQ